MFNLFKDKKIAALTRRTEALEQMVSTLLFQKSTPIKQVKVAFTSIKPIKRRNLRKATNSIADRINRAMMDGKIWNAKKTAKAIRVSRSSAASALCYLKEIGKIKRVSIGLYQTTYVKKKIVPPFTIDGAANAD